MATVKQPVATKVTLSASALVTLASGTYCASVAVSTTTNQPLDLILEVAAACTSTPTGNKQLLVFAQESLDGTNYRSGPTSGTTTTDEPDLLYIGALPMNTATTTHRKTFSLALALGYVPPSVIFVFKNDLGVALTSAAAATAEVSSTVA